MADTNDDDTRASSEGHEPLLPPDPAESSRVASTPLPLSAAPPVLPVSAREPGVLEHWRTPLVVALVVVVLVFGVLDISSILFRAPQNSGTTRPLIVNAQVVGDPAPAAHPDLGLAPAALTLACNTTGHVTVTNRSERPLQWTVATDTDMVTFSANTARTGLLGPGQSITLTVMAFSQPGAYLLHFNDDHGESADVTVQVSC